MVWWSQDSSGAVYANEMVTGIDYDVYYRKDPQTLSTTVLWNWGADRMNQSVNAEKLSDHRQLERQSIRQEGQRSAHPMAVLRQGVRKPDGQDLGLPQGRLGNSRHAGTSPRPSASTPTSRGPRSRNLNLGRRRRGAGTPPLTTPTTAARPLSTAGRQQQWR